MNQPLENGLSDLQIINNPQKYHMHKGKNLQIHLISTNPIITIQPLQQIGLRHHHALSHKRKINGIRIISDKPNQPN